MRNSRFTEDEIATWLADAERGQPIADVCRDAGISLRTFYRWREKFGALPVAAMRRLRRLEEENRTLKRAAALSGADLTARAAPPPSRWPFGPAVAAPARASTRAPSAYRNCRSH